MIIPETIAFREELEALSDGASASSSSSESTSASEGEGTAGACPYIGFCLLSFEGANAGAVVLAEEL